MDKDIYKLKLHEQIILDNRTVVRRVPGGWIYNDSIFVPFDNEFQQVDEEMDL